MIAAVVLAAGTSSRFGGDRPKQLLELDGRPLVRHAIDAARAAALDPIVVVTGHAAADVERVVPEGVRIVRNPNYRDGMGSSLRAGLDALGPEVDAAVVLLGDQPHVSPAAIRAVTETFVATGKAVVQAAYHEGAGHPVLLGRQAWTLLGEPAGDVGAREVIAAHPELVARAPVDEPMPGDVDTAADYDRIRRDP